MKTTDSRTKKRLIVNSTAIDFGDVPITGEPLDISIADKRWVTYVTSVRPQSVKALAAILKAGAGKGLDQSRVLFYLHRYCKSAEELSIMQRRDAAGFAIREAQKVLDNCEGLLKSLHQANGSPLTRNLTWLAANRWVGLLPSLNRYMNMLRWGIEENKKVATSKSSGLDDCWLILLAEEIRAKTGKPHLGRIAALVESGFMALALGSAAEIPSRRSLVARLERFKKRFPREADIFSPAILTQ